MNIIICPICGSEMKFHQMSERIDINSPGDYIGGFKDINVNTEKDIFMKCDCSAKLEFTLSEYTTQEIHIRSNERIIEKAIYGEL